MRREEEELQRALDESAKMADPRRGFVSSSSQPQKALPEQPNGRSSPSRDRDHGFAPPHRDSSISSQSRDERTPKRVRAIYDFEGGQGPDELPFRKGDVIRVTECVYTDWWKGELRGRTGIFPANRVVSFRSPWRISKHADVPTHTGSDPRADSGRPSARSRDGSGIVCQVGEHRQAVDDDAAAERERGGFGG